MALGVIVADRSGGHSWVCSRSMALMRGDFSSDTISADNDARVEWSAATAIEDPAAPSCASGTRMLPYLCCSATAGIRLAQRDEARVLSCSGDLTGLISPSIPSETYSMAS